MKDQVLTYIRLLADSVPNSREVFTRGCCFRLFLLLRIAWPEARALYDPVQGHVYTQIGKWLYDIRGRWVRSELHPHCYWLEQEPYLFKTAHKWHYLGKTKEVVMVDPLAQRKLNRYAQIYGIATVDQILDMACTVEDLKAACRPTDPVWAELATQLADLETYALLKEQLTL